MSLNTEGKAGPIRWENHDDSEGNPQGGFIEGVGFHIDWQNGVIVDPETGERLDPNGAFVEDVLAACKYRLLHLNAGKFRCRENSLVITKIEEAIHWIEHRTKERVARGVEGSHTP